MTEVITFEQLTPPSFADDKDLKRRASGELENYLGTFDGLPKDPTLSRAEAHRFAREDPLAFSLLMCTQNNDGLPHQSYFVVAIRKGLL